jgi:hypothetical protein
MDAAASASVPEPTKKKASAADKGEAAVVPTASESPKKTASVEAPTWFTVTRQLAKEGILAATNADAAAEASGNDTNKAVREALMSFASGAVSSTPASVSFGRHRLEFQSASDALIKKANHTDMAQLVALYVAKAKKHHDRAWAKIAIVLPLDCDTRTIVSVAMWRNLVMHVEVLADLVTPDSPSLPPNVPSTIVPFDDYKQFLASINALVDVARDEVDTATTALTTAAAAFVAAARSSIAANIAALRDAKKINKRMLRPTKKDTATLLAAAEALAVAIAAVEHYSANLFRFRTTDGGASVPLLSILRTLTAGGPENSYLTNVVWPSYVAQGRYESLLKAVCMRLDAHKMNDAIQLYIDPGLRATSSDICTSLLVLATWLQKDKIVDCCHVSVVATEFDADVKRMCQHIDEQLDSAASSASGDGSDSSSCASAYKQVRAQKADATKETKADVRSDFVFAKATVSLASSFLSFRKDANLTVQYLTARFVDYMAEGGRSRKDAERSDKRAVAAAATVEKNHGKMVARIVKLNEAAARAAAAKLKAQAAPKKGAGGKKKKKVAKYMDGEAEESGGTTEASGDWQSNSDDHAFIASEDSDDESRSATGAWGDQSKLDRDDKKWNAAKKAQRAERRAAQLREDAERWGGSDSDEYEEGEGEEEGEEEDDSGEADVDDDVEELDSNDEELVSAIRKAGVRRGKRARPRVIYAKSDEDDDEDEEETASDSDGARLKAKNRAARASQRKRKREGGRGGGRGGAKRRRNANAARYGYRSVTDSDASSTGAHKRAEGAPTNTMQAAQKCTTPVPTVTQLVSTLEQKVRCQPGALATIARELRTFITRRKAHALSTPTPAEAAAEDRSALRATRMLFAGSSGIGKTEASKAVISILKEDGYPVVEWDISGQTTACWQGVEGVEGGLIGHNNMTGAKHYQAGMRLHGDDVTCVLTIDEINLAPPATMEKLVTLLDQSRFSPTTGPAFWVRNLVVIVIANWGSNDDDARRYDAEHPCKASAPLAARVEAEAARAAHLTVSLQQRLGEDLDRANVSSPVRGRLPVRALFLPLSPASATTVVRNIIVGTINALVPRTRSGPMGPASIHLVTGSVCDAVVACYDHSTGARYARDAAAQLGTELGAIIQNHGWDRGTLTLAVEPLRSAEGAAGATTQQAKLKNLVNAQEKMMMACNPGESSMVLWPVDSPAVSDQLVCTVKFLRESMAACSCAGGVCEGACMEERAEDESAEDICFNVQRVDTRPRELKLARANSVGKVAFLLRASERARIDASAVHHGGVAFDPAAISEFVDSFGAGTLEDELGGEGTTGLLASADVADAGAFVAGPMAFLATCQAVRTHIVSTLKYDYDISDSHVTFAHEVDAASVRWKAEGIKRSATSSVYAWRVTLMGDDASLQSLAYSKNNRMEANAFLAKAVEPFVVPLVWWKRSLA